VSAAGDQQASTDLARSADEKPVGEYSGVGENSPSTIGEKTPLAKIQKPLSSSSKDFSPTHFSPTPGREFSPTKKPRLSLVKPSKNGQRGRPRNPELPPAPGTYFYWTKARNGLKLERRKKLERKSKYEYVGFVMPSEWEHLRGNFNEEYILRAIIAAIRVKRARAAQSRLSGAVSA